MAEMKLFKVAVFPNGNVMVFDREKKEQVPELQGPTWKGAKERILELADEKTLWYGYNPPPGKGKRVG